MTSLLQPSASPVLSGVQPLAPLPEKEDKRREFGDAAATRQAVFDQSLAALRGVKPFTNARHTLALTDVDYQGPDRYSLAEQKAAILEGRSLGRKLRGTWRLTDNVTGQPIEEKKATLATIPYLTDRGTFINNGVEYTLSNQMRLKPGVFTRVKNNGEIEAHVNILPGEGRAHRYHLDPAKAVFYANIGQAKIPLLPLLRAMGADDKRLREAWGPDIMAANLQNDNPAQLSKFFEKFLKKDDLTKDDMEKKKALIDVMSQMRTDPDVMKRTLGKPYSNLGLDAILDTTRKLLAVARNEADVDDRDHLAFQTVHGPEDLIAERLARDYGGVQRGMFHRASWAGNLKHVSPNALSKQVQAALLHSGLGQCYDADTYVLVRRGFTRWSEVRDDDEFACRIDGKVEYHLAKKVIRQQYNGPMIGCRTKRFSYLVTPNHRCFYRLRERTGRPDPVYQTSTAAELFGRQRWHLTSLGDTAKTQAVETFDLCWTEDRHGHQQQISIPADLWVEYLGWWLAEGSAFLDGRTYKAVLAQSRSANPAECDAIEELLSQLPFNWRLGSNGTDYIIANKGLSLELQSYGTRDQKRIPRYIFDYPTSLLRRLFDAYMLGDGNDYAGYFKSETASLGLAHDLVELWGRLGGTAQISPHNTSDGVYWVVSYNLATERCIESSTAASKKGYDPHFQQDYDGIVYCAEVPGGLLYVMRDGKPHWSHNSLEEINPADVFDKQSRISRLGEGGIPSIEAVPDEARSVQPSHLAFMDPMRTPECYDEKTEVMTATGWKQWTDVTADDRFACLVGGRLEFHSPLAMIAQTYDGPMFGAETKLIDYLVTPNHRMYVRPYCLPHECPEWRIETADTVHNRNRRLRCGGHQPWAGDESPQWFELPAAEKRSNNVSHVDRIDFDDWAELVGWFLSEGHFTYDEAAPTYNIGISQSREANPENCQLIEDLLGRLPFAWNYNQSMKCYILATKQLASYFRQFGYCYEKWIPEELLTASIASRERLFESLLRGDGRVNGHGEINQFSSTSKRLAEDFQRLAFSLGWSCRLVREPENREEHYHDNWVVHLHTHDERVITRKNRKLEHYTGNVYCAEVPGGLLYVRRNNKCGFWCGNSFKVGVDVHIARSAMKGSDGKIYSPFTDRRTGQTVYKSPQDVADLTVAFPGEMEAPGGRAWAMSGGKVRWAKKNEVDLVVPQMENAFSPLGNMIPFKSATKGQRGAMGSRFITQALPLVKPESPYVQSGVPGSDDDSYEAQYGKHMGALHAKGEGRVMAVNPDSIQIRYADGNTETHDLYQNFPYNRKTYLHQTPTVKPGDVVKPNQTIAHSNYTDKDGVTALGLNARVAYLPYQGKNFEDAIVISRSMAKRLSSEHMYQHRLDKTSDHKVGRGSFISLFPGKFDRRQLETIDKNGIVMPGTEVREGDPLILGAVAKAPAKNKVHRRGGKSFGDASITWDHHAPGIVTDIVDTDKGITVLVKSVNEMQEGDKLSGRYGDKGVVADIVPDDQMPHDRDGRPFEVLLNPNGTISRTNPSQYAEAALGKIAALTGKAYRVQDFGSIKDVVEFAQRELARHNLTDTEDVIDPVTGRKLKDNDGNTPMAGNRFFMKLHHTAEGKGAGRGTGGYTMEGAPAKGGPLGSKRISMMDVNALLSHGATQVLRDAGQVRGQDNPDFWLAYQQGHHPPDPGVPLVYQKFVNSLKGAGINVIPEGTGTHIMALTNKDVRELAGDREVTSGDTVDFDNALTPVAGGLFDPQLTGGHNGNRWSYIKLHEPMPNPVMEEPIRRILGLTQEKFEKVLAGKEKIQVGSVTTTGPEGVKHALEAINLDRELLRTREEIKHGKKTARDQAIRKLGYLKSAKRLGISPGDWMLDRVPVLPPKFRPLAVMSDSKLPLVSDANFLYKELIDANKNLREMSDEVDDVGEERLSAYHAFKAVTGMADPLHPKLQEKQVKGILKHIFGSSPKFGTVQRRLLSSTVDLVGRGVITPNPDLDMDTVGLPEEKAWDVYEPFVVRRLRRKGLPLAQAKQAVQGRDPAARRELLAEMDHRPVFINRAPVLHRFGIMAFRPRLTKSETVQFSPLIVKGFGADFDGDAVQYHVPVREEAVKEALDRMLPSRNLLSPADFKTPVHMPGQEYVGGLYEATSPANPKHRVHRFATRRDAIRAFMTGEIPIGTPIEIDE